MPDGATSSLNTLKTTQKNWLDNKLIRILVQFALTRSRDLADAAQSAAKGADLHRTGSLPLERILELLFRAKRPAA